MNTGDAATLCIILESWLRSEHRNGRSPGAQRDEVKRAGKALAVAAPLTAENCEYLLRLTGLTPQMVTAGTPVQIPWSDSTGDSEVAPTAVNSAPLTMTASEAGMVLGITGNGVRYLLRQRVLTGRKTERGWQVNAQSVTRYKTRRTAA